MNFQQALELMKQGKKVKRKHWSGYWVIENDTVMMYCKDGLVLDIREGEDILYTLSNVGSDDWEVANEDNSKLVSGELIRTHTFESALRQVKQGKGMRLPQWSKDVVIRCQLPDEHSKMTAPYLYVESRFGRVPWKETMIEMFSDKWQIVE